MTYWRVFPSVLIFSVFAACVCASPGEMVAARASAMISGVSGEVSRAQQPVEMLAMLYPGDVLELTAGATLSIVLLEGLREYTATGPVTLRVTGQGIVSASGAPVASRDLFPERNLRLREGYIEEASTRTRGYNPQATIDISGPTAAYVDGRPLFEWYAPDLHSDVYFHLYDVHANVLHAQALAGQTLQLPVTVTLDPGAHYTWTVTGYDHSGRKASAQGDFVVATAAQRKWKQQLGNCSVSGARMLACALLLEQAGFLVDATALWDDLEEMASADDRLRAEAVAAQ